MLVTVATAVAADITGIPPPIILTEGTLEYPDPVTSTVIPVTDPPEIRAVALAVVPEEKHMTSVKGPSGFSSVGFDFLFFFLVPTSVRRTDLEIAGDTSNSSPSIKNPCNCKV